MLTIDLKRENLATVIPMVFEQPTCRSLFDKTPEETFKRGQTIFWERNHADKYIYLVTNGMVKLSSSHQNREMLEDYFQKGELLNCPAVLGGAPQEMTATAMVPQTSIKKIPIPLFRQALRSNSSLYEEVMSNLSASLQRTQDRLHRLTLLSAQQRVYDFLAKHAVQSGRKVGFEYVIKPVLTHQEIGYIAGVGRQTVTTVLNELRREGVIHFTRRYLLVRNLTMLQDLARSTSEARQ